MAKSPVRTGSWVLLSLLFLPGCGQFFPRAPSTAPGGGSGGGTGGGSGGGGGSTPGAGSTAIYVANSNAQLQSIAALSLNAGKLANLPNSPSSLGVIPSALAINPAGTLLWAGSLLGSIFAYVVNSDGSLTLGNNRAPVGSALVNAMTVDPSGKWLLVLSGTGIDTAPLLYVYGINSSNGVLTQAGTQIALDPGAPFQLVFAPNGTRLFAALGTGGVDELTFSPASGAVRQLNVRLQPLDNSYADQGVAVDPTGSYLLVAETGTNGVRSLAIQPNGSLSEVADSPYSTGLGAKAVLVEKSGAYVYVSNSATNTISAFALAAGTLTELTGSPFTTGTSPYALAEDKTGTYLIAACSGGSPDLQVFSIAAAGSGTPGALSSVATASTGNSSPAGASALVTTP